MLRTHKPLRAKKPLNRVSPKKFQPRGEWHPQRVRLTPAQMHTLRSQVFERAFNPDTRQHECEDCSARITWFRFDLAHILARGKGGSDTPENTLALCRECHRAKRHKGLQWSKKEKQASEEEMKQP